MQDLNLSKIDGNGRGEEAGGMKIFARKMRGSLSKNEGIAILYWGFFGDSTWWSTEKKSWCICLSFVNKHVLQNKCPSKNMRWLPLIVLIYYFSNCYLAVPRPASDHYRRGSLTHLILITGFLHIWPEGHWESCNAVVSLSPNGHLWTGNRLILLTAP